MTENNYVTDDDDGGCFEKYYSGKNIKNDTYILMVSLRETDSYLNYEEIQMGDIEMMTAEYGSSVSFGSRVRSKFIGYNTYTGRRSIFCS